MIASRWCTAGLTVTLALATAGATASQSSYEASIQKWRRDADSALRADDGWLTVAGLFWLRTGPNRAGTDPSNEIVLPSGTAPPRIGVFRLAGGRTTFETEPGAPVLINGSRTDAARLDPDVDRVTVGDLTMFVIRRGERYGIRLRDKNSEARRTFTGRVWFPVRTSYKVTGRFIPFNPPREIAIVNVLGDVAPMSSPGCVEFALNGQTLRLDPVTEPGARELFFILKDQTAGSGTYPAGRFLYAELPENGRVELDFNKAVNPPCAFTAFATCPLPPTQNVLRVRIEAGERYVGHK
jgi:hypothetical protein